MGAAASISQEFADEVAKPVDGSDVNTPRGETAKAEVVRLRALLASKLVVATPCATPLSKFGFDLSQESFDKDFATIAPGVWSVCTEHNPGNLAAMPKHNNRALVFAIKDTEAGDFLFVYGIPDSQFIQNLKAVETAAGLPIKYVMTSGCWHHLYLEDWIAAFAEPVKFLMTSAKFPVTRNGTKLLADEAMKARIEVYDTEVPFLTKYADQIQFVVMDQQTTFPDAGAFAATKELVPAEKIGEVMAEFGKQKKSARFASVNLYHLATKSCVIDHNFDMFQPEDVWDKQSEMEQNFHPRGKFQSNVQTGNEVVDAAKNVEQIQQLLKLDCRYIMDLHTPPTYNVITFPDQAAFAARITSVFEETGEMDPTGEALIYKNNVPAPAPAE